MNEDFASRAWADNHAKLTTSFGEVLATIGRAMRVLNEKQFEAPWKSGQRDDCTAC